MKRRSCSGKTPEVAIKGAYYGEHMARAESDGRICSVPHDAGYAVYTFWSAWDSDAAALWAVQFPGRETHCINFHSDDKSGLGGYAGKLDEWREDLNYIYCEHVWPRNEKRASREDEALEPPDRIGRRLSIRGSRRGRDAKAEGRHQHTRGHRSHRLSSLHCCRSARRPRS